MAIALAGHAAAGWFAALARLRLAQVLDAAGDPLASRHELERIVAWSHDPDAWTDREYFFLVLGGDPIHEAQSQLASHSWS